MVLYNISTSLNTSLNNSLLAFIPPTLTYHDLISNYCNQISETYITFASIILIGTILNSFMLHVAFKTFQDLIPYNMQDLKLKLNFLVNHIKSFFETGLIISSIMLIIFTIYSIGFNSVKLFNKLLILFAIFIIGLVCFRNLLIIIKSNIKKLKGYIKK